MVEGPGTTRNSKKAKLLINRRLLSVQCNSSSEVFSRNDKNSTNPWFTDRYLSEVFSVGKELFLVFASLHNCTSGSLSATESHNGNDDLFIRFHFGMSGTLIVKNLNSTGKENFKGIPTLCLTFGSLIQPERSGESENETLDIQMIEIYDTTFTGPANASIAKQKFLHFRNLDVCSPSFSRHHVFEKMRLGSNAERIISDALLDQNIYPGVGNIIKVEGLHAAGINPKQTICSIQDEKLFLVIDSCRNYAMKWLQTGYAPQKSVYNKPKCNTCKEQAISMQRVGETHRTTFWCIQCQPLQLIRGNEGGTVGTLRINDQQQILSNNSAVQRVCPMHGPDKLVLRRARKGVNAYRIFLSCKARNCNYFSWADTHFPQCACKKRAILLMSKTARTGGKWFFSCRNDRGSKCKYFAWAQQRDLASLGDTLTPLL